MKKQLVNLLPLLFAATAVSAEVAPMLVPSCFDGTAALDESGRFEAQVLTTDDGEFKVINDKATGLQWAYCPYGQSTTAEGSCTAEQLQVPTPNDWATDQNSELNKVLSAENTRLGENTNLWRAPNFNEAMSIYNKNCSPNIYSNFYYAQFDQVKVEELYETETWNQKTYVSVLGEYFTFRTDTKSRSEQKQNLINYGFVTDVLYDHSVKSFLRLVRETPQQL